MYRIHPSKFLKLLFGKEKKEGESMRAEAICHDSVTTITHTHSVKMLTFHTKLVHTADSTSVQAQLL